MANIINPNELFNRVPDEKIHLNDFSLSHDNVHTTEAGRCVPVACIRVLPGEKFRVSATPFIRTMPLVSPIFGKMDYYLHAFYVTNNTVSEKWKDYIRNGESGEEQLQPDMLRVDFYDQPCLDLRENDFFVEFQNLFDGIYCFGGPDFDKSQRPFFTHGSLSDYLGIGSVSFDFVDDAYAKYGESDGIHYLYPFNYSLIPFKCYQSIWSEYYADANIMTFDDMDTIDFNWMRYIDDVHIYGNSATSLDSDIGHYVSNGIFTSEFSKFVEITNLFKLRHRCYAKDYFTSSLPEPQRGPDVLIPIGADIEIINNFESSDPTLVSMGNTGTKGTLGFEFGFYPTDVTNQYGSYATLGSSYLNNSGSDFHPTSSASIYNAQQLRAELSSLTSTITDLRTAVALQEFYESKARYGNRYKEFIYGSFGSMIPDNQLYRPWYLGGMKLPIQISEVLQTANNADGSGVGDMYGKGVSGGSGFLFEREFSDYGTIMIIESIRPRNYYSNHIDRTWTVDDSLDEYWRKLQGVGEQEVYNFELQGFFSSSPSYKPLDTFGYQMRFSEYKQMMDSVHGDFKGSLDYWTIFRKFNHGVALNREFLEVHPSDVAHIFQYSGLDVDHFLVNLSLDIVRTAPMDIYSIPRIN